MSWWKGLPNRPAPFSPRYHLGQAVIALEALPQGGFRLKTAKATEIEARAVIVAAGSGAFGPNRPPLDGIEQYEGKSVFYLVGRREDFRGKRVVIAGGGDSAVDWAISLSRGRGQGDGGAPPRQVPRRARLGGKAPGPGRGGQDRTGGALSALRARRRRRATLER